jgi:hypothetical protein
MIIMDSSLYEQESSQKRSSYKDHGIHIGTIKEIQYNKKATPNISYLVEMLDTIGRYDHIWCEPMVKFGSPVNYEHFVYNSTGGLAIEAQQVKGDMFKCGDKVVVASIDGSANYGIILGCVAHDKMPAILDKDDGIVYIKEFNGVETIINSAGEYTLTFKGIPTNLKEIMLPPSRLKPIPDPIYDDAIGGSKFKFHYDGSIELNDDNDQSVFINKSEGTITIHSGHSFIIFSKKEKTMEIYASDSDFSSEKSINSSTELYQITANDKFLVKSPKIALGTPEIELLAQIVELVGKIGECTVISPVGPCTAISASPQWSGVDQIKGKIEQIKGTL